MLIMASELLPRRGFYVRLLGFLLLAGYLILLRPRIFARYAYVMSRFLDYEEARRHLPSPPKRTAACEDLETSRRARSGWAERCRFQKKGRRLSIRED